MTFKEQLIQCFKEAKAEGASFIFTEIDLGKEYPENEIIINPVGNIDVKLDYLCAAYDDDLKHPKAPIKIVSFGYCDNLGQLEYEIANKKDWETLS